MQALTHEIQLVERWLRSGELAIGDFRFEELIGVGAHGSVFAGRHRLGFPVAAKILHLRHAADPAVRCRFVGEALIGARLGDAAHTARLYDAGRVLAPDGRTCFYSIWTRLFGSPLGVYRDGELRTKLTPATAIKIGIQCAGVLQVLHNLGVTHGDLRPDHVLIEKRPDGNPVAFVIDFTAAHAVWLPRAAGAGSASTPLGATQVLHDDVLGTLEYSAPERLLRDETTRLSDVYSLGVVLYELLAGRLPYRALHGHGGDDDPRAAMIRAHRGDPPDPPSRHPKTIRDIPRALDDVVLEMLATDERRRPPLMSDVGRRLKHVLAALPIDLGTGTAPLNNYYVPEDLGDRQPVASSEERRMFAELAEPLAPPPVAELPVPPPPPPEPWEQEVEDEVGPNSPGAWRRWWLWAIAIPATAIGLFFSVTLVLWWAA